jgi:4'-phosphopantetheinyl transferase
MKDIDLRGLKEIAVQLGEYDMHVFLLPYERAQKRRPLQDVLGAYLGISGDAVTLVDGQFGRPALDRRHDPALGFNWSHSGDRALIAIGRNVTPGIDIERVRERPKALQIAEHYFCEEEFARLACMPVETRHIAFLELWTAKEAVLKALGRGIAFGLDRLHVAHVAGQPVLRWLDGDDATAWQLRRLNMEDRCVGAIAWRGSAKEIGCWALSI